MENREREEVRPFLSMMIIYMYLWSMTGTTGWERIVRRGQILQVDEMISKSLIHDIAVGDSLVSPYVTV